MRDSVPSLSYSSVCNVLRQWNIPLIPTLESTDSMIRKLTLLAMINFFQFKNLLFLICFHNERRSANPWVNLTEM